jgi:CubicO group peptidase (beta-lactamase class C family)
MMTLRPKVAVSSHYAGWMCIHDREGAWNSDTGNGYHGGLQMSYGWAGRVGDAAMLSPDQQIAVADAEARVHGYDDGWMRSQWPNTYPPCAGYFH